MLTFSGKLPFAPLGKLHRVLDVGTGTGIWAINFGAFSSGKTDLELMLAADVHSEAQVGSFHNETIDAENNRSSG